MYVALPVKIRTSVLGQIDYHNTHYTLYHSMLLSRLSYVHRMALFRLSTQIKEQTNAFIKGFHSLINPSLIKYFSAEEFQRIISGDQADVDVDDLRWVVHFTLCLS